MLLDIAAGEASPLGRQAEALLGQHQAIKLATDLFERDWMLSEEVGRIRDQVDGLMQRYREVLERYEEPGTTAADADVRTARRPRPQEDHGHEEGAG